MSREYTDEEDMFEFWTKGAMGVSRERKYISENYVMGQPRKV
jgi:hypothetical protein